MPEVTPPPSEVSSTHSRWSHWLLLGVLNIYAAALLVAAWPDGRDFGRLQPIHDASRELFERLHTRSASYVFSGNRGAWKRLALCISVVGKDESGGTRELYTTYPSCITPDVRVFEDTFGVLLVRSGHSREMKAFLGANANDTRKELVVLRRSRALDRASRYFCYSQQVDNQGIVEVDLFWKIEQVHYGSGKKREDFAQVHGYDCLRDRAIRRIRDSSSKKTSRESRNLSSRRRSEKSVNPSERP